MTKVLSARVDDDLAAWADEYAKERGVTRQALLEEAVRTFREDCERGVPEIRERARRQALQPATGECPKNAAGHVWASAKVDPRRSCRFCGAPGRGDHARGESGHLAMATAARAEFFARLKAPMQNGTGDPRKAHPERS